LTLRQAWVSDIIHMDIVQTNNFV